MNILLVTNMYPSKCSPSYGVFVKNIYQELYQIHKGGLKLCAMTYSENKFIPYVRFYINFLNQLVFNDFDIVYCHFISRTSILGAIAKFIFRKKVIFNIHGSDYLQPKMSKSFLHRLNLWSINFCDGVVVPSKTFKNLLISDIGVKIESKAFVSPSGGIVVPTDYNYDARDILPLKCLFVGRVCEMKGVDTIIDAMNKVTWDIELTVVGKIETNLFNTLYNKHVSIILVGEVEQFTLKEYYSKSNVFLFPTKYFESLGLTPLEAMGHALPVIASNIGPVSEYVQDGYNGFLIDKGDSDHLLKCLKHFSQLDASQRKYLSVNALNTSLKYSRESVIKNLLAYLERCCENE